VCQMRGTPDDQEDEDRQCENPEEERLPAQRFPPMRRESACPCRASRTG
jgi:hypothetical protein